MSYVADGIVKTESALPLANRLVQLHDSLSKVIKQFNPSEAAVEKTFVNRNAASSLKLGHARAISLLVPASAGISVSEYSPNLIKKALVGAGHADKGQVQMMVRTLLPGAVIESPDAADALAVAVCHAHHRDSYQVRLAVAK